MTNAKTRSWRFSPRLERSHKRLDTDSWDRIFVIGDVHGCIGTLERLFDRVDFAPADLGVLVGDLVRKGPASGEVLGLVHSRPNLVTVRGNNEQKIIDGEADLGLSSAEIEYLASLPLAVSFDGNLVVHGGVDPRKPFVEQTAADLLECRSIASAGGYTPPFWFEAYEGPPRVFFGHTVLDTPYDGDWAVGLDTGCVHGGSLTAYEVTEDVFWSVPAESTYKPRSADSILSPSAIRGRQ